MANTYIAIATVTAGSGGSSTIEFTNIPNTYTDLCILLSLRNEGVNGGAFMRFNGDTGSNYKFTRLKSNWSSVTADTNTSQTKIFLCIDPSSADASNFGSAMVYIPNYAGSSAKVCGYDSTLENNASTYGGDGLILGAGYWSGTSAITSISFVSEDAGKTLVQHSTATLYGIKKS